MTAYRITQPDPDDPITYSEEECKRRAWAFVRQDPRPLQGPSEHVRLRAVLVAYDRLADRHAHLVRKNAARRRAYAMLQFAHERARMFWESDRKRLIAHASEYAQQLREWSAKAILSGGQP